MAPRWEMVADEGIVSRNIYLNSAYARQAQSSLHPFGSHTLDIGIQAYADLIKAYWIVVDIIVEHPQQKYLYTGSQRLEIELLIEVELLSSAKVTADSTSDGESRATKDSKSLSTAA